MVDDGCDEVFARLVATRAGLEEGADGEDDEDDLEEGTAGVVTVGGLHIASNDRRTRDLVKGSFQSFIRLGHEREQRLQA